MISNFIHLFSFLLRKVSAAKRPKNSALEVDLDFEHNRGPPPVITEESTDIVEDIILKRIREVIQLKILSFL